MEVELAKKRIERIIEENSLVGTVITKEGLYLEFSSGQTLLIAESEVKHQALEALEEIKEEIKNE